MKTILATVICAVAAIYAATVFAENAAKEPEKKDFTPEFVAQCKAKAEAGDAEAQELYAKALENGWGVERDRVKGGIEWLRKSAERGYARAQDRLGLRYEIGFGGVEKDLDKSFEWYTKAAEQGLSDAQFHLGRCYENGRGAEKDMAKAVEWYTKAAEKGHDGGQYFLGTCYFSGRGVEKDKSKAIELWMKAADQGHSGAQCNLGVCYKNGDGVEKDVNKAAEWLGKASLQGIGEAVNILGEILDNHDFDSDIRANRETYETALRVGREKLGKRWLASGWTTNDTERFWASVASLATRIVMEPRTGKADTQKGEGMLEAFGERYMPNAYDNYCKVREKAIEREQMLKEKFPEGAKSDTTGEGLYQKIAKATAKAISEYDRRHDELCHFYLMHKAGFMTDAELAELDEAKICIMLPLADMDVKMYYLEYGSIKTLAVDKEPIAPKAAELDFARKYKPETFAAYERLKVIYGESVKQYGSLFDDALVLDAVRGGGVLAPLAQRLNLISSKLQQIAKTLSKENLLHEVEEITAEKLADSDAKFGIEVRAFEKGLPVRGWAGRVCVPTRREGPIALVEAPVFALPSSMVPIYSKNFAICKYEVTQALWVAVMGGNPPRSCEEALHPVVNVSWYDCRKFLKKLNALPEVKESGKIYRLPTADEWEYACRAGETNDYSEPKIGYGTGTHNTLRDAWHNGNLEAKGKIYCVNSMDYNRFGLYFMHENVWEWTSSGDGDRRVFCGGSRGDHWDGHVICWKGCRYRSDASCRDAFLGFRLAADLAAEH